jgi:hypothetical protein
MNFLRGCLQVAAGAIGGGIFGFFAAPLVYAIIFETRDSLGTLAASFFGGLLGMFVGSMGVMLWGIYKFRPTEQARQ